MKQVYNCWSLLGMGSKEQEQESIPTTTVNLLQIRTVFMWLLTSVEGERGKENKLGNHATESVKQLND